MEPIMFHYFHDDKTHRKVDGSLSANQLEEIINSTVYNVLSADTWFRKYDEGTLEDNDTCLTFDDGIKEQYDIAVPILDKHRIKGLFNICTFFFTGDEDTFEIHRYFRNNYFESINGFYEHYFQSIESLEKELYDNVCLTVNFEQYIGHATFYTTEDRKFRYFRDVVFKEKHSSILEGMMQQKGLDKYAVAEKLWISQGQISDMSRNHLIGIHTHEHSTTIDQWDKHQQQRSYHRNKKILEKIISDEITICAYPCGKSNDETAPAISELGIKHGMIASTTERLGDNHYLIPRVDSTDFYKLIKSKK
jgi:peptidoglycan/xylan/chitin deacetylase (PgdA/CDA1 family)